MFLFLPETVDYVVYGLDRPRNGRVNVGGNKALLRGYELPFFYLVADIHDGQSGCAYMLRNAHVHRCGGGHIFNRRILGEFRAVYLAPVRETQWFEDFQLSLLRFCPRKFFAQTVRYITIYIVTPQRDFVNVKRRTKRIFLL